MRATTLSAAACLLVAAAWEFGVAGGAPRQDETAYLVGVRAAAAGGSPYETPDRAALTPYPPTFHAGLVFLVGRLGEDGTLRTLRALNALGAIALLGLSARLGGLGDAGRVVFAGLALLSPPFHRAADLGNLSPLASALTLVLLVGWKRVPLAAGLAGAAQLLLKPTGAAAVPLLLRKERRALAAVAVCVAVAGAALLASPHLGSFLAARKGYVSAADSVGSASLGRAGALLGLAIPDTLLFAAVAVAGAVVAWRTRPGPRALAVLGAWTSVVSLPRVWEHTFVLASPAIAILVRASWLAWRAAPPGARRPALATGLARTAGATLLLGSHAWAESWDGVPRPVLALATLVPLLAFTALSRDAWRVASASDAGTTDA